MTIKFSRHAQRRLKLYGIDPADVESVVQRRIAQSSIINARESIIAREFKEKYTYPLKIIYTIEQNAAVIITAYPQKKERMP